MAPVTRPPRLRRGLGLCLVLAAAGSSLAPAADVPDRYLRIHCQRRADGPWPFQEPPPTPGDAGGGRLYYLDTLPIEVGSDGSVVIHCLPFVSEGASRRRYAVSKTARELLPEMCAGGLDKVLDLIARTELRQPWNDLYAADEQVPDGADGPVQRLGDWRLVSRSRGGFRSIAPAPPAFIAHPFRARIVARSEEELWTGIASGYRVEGWERKQMDAVHVKQVQRQWLASLGIDFAKQMVVGIFYGSEEVQPHAEIGIDAVRAGGGGLRVDCYRAAVRRGDGGPNRYPYPYYELIVCDRTDGPVVFHEDGRRVGRAHADDLESIREHFRKGGIVDLVPGFAPLSGGAVALAYPRRQFFRVERQLPDRHDTFVLGVDEMGKVRHVEDSEDYADGAIGGWGPEDRQRLVAAAVMTLRGALAGGYSADLFGRVRCRKGVDELIACSDGEEEPRFEVRFDAGGRLAMLVDHAVEPRPEAAPRLPVRVAEPAPPRKAPIPPAPQDTGLEALVKDLESSDYIVRTTAAARLGESRDPRAIEPLIAFLRQEKYGEGAGVAALKELGRAAAEPLIAALAAEWPGGDVVFLGKVAEILGESREPLAVEPLVRALGHADIGVRSRAAIALGKLQDPRAVGPLIAALRADRHYMVREHAAEALGRLRARDALQPLVEALKDSAVRDYAAKALKEIDAERALSLLRDALAEDPARSSVWAIPALQHLGDEAVEPLLACLQEADEEVRRRALGAIRNVLARGSGKRAAIVDTIIRFFETGRGDFLSPDEQVTTLEVTEDRRAMKLMARLPGRTNGVPPHQLLSALSRRYVSGIAEEAFLAALVDVDENVRIGAAACLGVLKSRRAARQLIGLLQDRNQRLRFNAARSLGDIGDRQAVGPLTGVAKDKREPEEVRLQAVLALRKLKGPEADAALLAIQGDPTTSREIRLSAMSTAEALMQNEELRAQLLKSLSSRNQEQRMEAAAALAALGEARATDVLIEGLRDRSSGVRLRAVVGLTVANDARSAGPLLALLETEKDAEISEAARRAIASHLRALKPAPLVALLKERRQSRENRIFAIEVLGELRSREGIEPLVAALKADDESEEVKKGCLQALMRIEGLDLQRLLLALLDRKDAALNRFIAAGIQQLTGQDLGADSQKMRQWVLQNRGRLEDK